MADSCNTVVFSNKAYNAIIGESFDKDPVETGGILLGHVHESGIWVVMEVLPPGIKCIFQQAYFEYDETFVNYLAQSVANQYKKPLELLGLWHRHPGSMDHFSPIDDGTNLTFANLNPKGVISGLVNIDNKFRLTMYHLDKPSGPMSYAHPEYKKVDIAIGDDIIPKYYFELRYYDNETDDLHPTTDARRVSLTPPTTSSTSIDSQENEHMDSHPTNGDIISKEVKDVVDVVKKKWLATLLILIFILISGYMVIRTYKTVVNGLDWFNRKSDERSELIHYVNLDIGDSVNLMQYITDGKVSSKDIKWIPENDTFRINNSILTASDAGTKTIVATYGNDIYAVFEINSRKEPDISADSCLETPIEMDSTKAINCMALQNNIKFQKVTMETKVGSSFCLDDSLFLSIFTLPQDARWNSSNTIVATIDREGNVKTHVPGFTNIYNCYNTSIIKLIVNK